MGNEKYVFKKSNFKFIFEEKKINVEISMYKTISNHSIKSSDVVKTYLLTFIILKNMITFYIYIYKFTYTCKCMDINLDRNLSAYISQTSNSFFNCIAVIKKNPSFYYAKSVPKKSHSD